MKKSFKYPIKDRYRAKNTKDFYPYKINSSVTSFQDNSGPSFRYKKHDNDEMIKSKDYQTSLEKMTHQNFKKIVQSPVQYSKVLSK